MEFDASIAKAKAVTSLDEAKEWLDRAFANAIAVIGAASDEALFESIPDTRIMGGAPRAAVVSAIVDHTAHHRGSLAVYARLVGKEPNDALLLRAGRSEVGLRTGWRTLQKLHQPHGLPPIGRGVCRCYRSCLPSETTHEVFTEDPAVEGI